MRVLHVYCAVQAVFFYPSMLLVKKGVDSLLSSPVVRVESVKPLRRRSQRRLHHEGTPALAISSGFLGFVDDPRCKDTQQQHDC